MATTFFKITSGNSATYLSPPNGHDNFFWESESTRCLNEKLTTASPSSYSSIDLMGNFVDQKNKKTKRKASK
ncbi:hypothetical protein [Mucilaginibacter celer]|uniref:hypothetical protein n=1 Tax=Mucilaginibacter celer TaxID=2305508 RepID=UPI0013CE9490|nr:hypothetical protein [Mucilaginibacter celer]